MKKRILLIPLFLGSLFTTSNVYSAVFELYEKQNNNLLIAEGGCGGKGGGGSKNIKDKKEAELKSAEKSLQFFKSKKAEAEAKGESTEKIDKKIEKWEKKIIELDPEYYSLKDEITGGDPNTWGPVNFKDLNINQINILKEKIDPMMILIWEPYRRLAEENKRRQESGEYEDGEYMELMGLSPISLNFTEAGLDSEKDGNEARAETYHKLAIKSIENSLNKNEFDPSEEHHHHGLLAINHYYLGDFENSNKSLKKAAKGYKKPKELELTKNLIAATAILSGNVNQGCQELFDYLAGGDITIDSTFPIEDFCIFDEE